MQANVQQIDGVFMLVVIISSSAPRRRISSRTCARCLEPAETVLRGSDESFLLTQSANVHALEDVREGLSSRVRSVHEITADLRERWIHQN